MDAIELPTVTDSSGKPLFTGLYSGPYFDLRRMAKNQTAQIGDNVLIHCAVKQAGQRAVSQIHTIHKMYRLEVLNKMRERCLLVIALWAKLSKSTRDQADVFSHGFLCNTLFYQPFFKLFVQVSWVRKADGYILSVDSSVFISDQRFKVLRPQPSTEWNLHIK